MAFDIGGLFGGGLSGAAAGSAFGPIGAVAGGVLGGLGSAFGGGGPAEYQLTPLQEEQTKYAMKQMKASPKRKKAIKQQFKSLQESGNRGAAEAFLESYRDRFSNPEFIEKKLAKSYGKDIDFGAPAFQNIADRLYKQQGIGYSAEDYGGFAEQAKSLGIRSPQAFQDMLRQDMIASGKVMTPQQEMLSYMFGMPGRYESRDEGRDESGRIMNTYKKYVPTYQPTVA